MTAQELLEKLLDSYRQSFDITLPFQVDGHVYDAYAAFNGTSAKYECSSNFNYRHSDFGHRLRNIWQMACKSVGD